MRKCATKYCRRTLKKGRVCSTCRSRKCREANPERYWYNNHKSHAKERKIPHDLTFEEFVEFGVRTKYFIGKDRTVWGLTINRLNDNPALGYHGYRKDNIESIPNLINVLKYHLRWMTDERGVPCFFRFESTKGKSMAQNNYEKTAHLLCKFLGMVGRLRKYEKEYEKSASKLKSDLKRINEQREKVDGYIRIILKSGYQPIFEDDTEQRLFPNTQQKPAA